MKLYSEYGYDKALPNIKRGICNGCGKTGWQGFIVPDSMYFLGIGEACNIHDWMYEYGKDVKDKDRADRSFRNNLIRIIDEKTNWNWLKKLRYKRAETYYQAVVKYGGPAFWKNGT